MQSQRALAFAAAAPLTARGGAPPPILPRRRARGVPAVRRSVPRASAAGGAVPGAGKGKGKEQSAGGDFAKSDGAADTGTAAEAGEADVESVSSAAKQVDDGSLSEGVSFVRPRSVRRKKGVAVSSPAPAEVALGRRRRAPLAFLVSRLDSHKSFFDTLFLGGLFLTWYWANTVFNVYNKQVLKVFPFPVTCTAVQFLVAAICMAALWISRVKPTPRFNRQLVRATAPLAVLHAAGFLLTNMSLGKVSVAFTHTVKSTEPFFSVALTPSILGEVPTWGIMMSLFPIVAGVGLASLTDVSFNWIGFLSAVGSNLALQSRNVLSKKLMSTSSATAGGGSPSFTASKQSSVPVAVAGDGGGAMVTSQPAESAEEVEEDTMRSLDNVNLFSTMTIGAFVLLLPLALVLEGTPLLGAAAAPAVTGMTSALLARKLTLGGVCRCLDVLSSYMILQRVSPVTHSVGNCVKRAVVISMSIVIFKTKMSALNIVGTLLALAGVFVYSVVVSACKQNSFGPESPLCKPVYDMEVELTQGGGI